MLAKTFAKYQELRPAVKSLVFLYWIYIFTSALIGVFVQIFLYERFASIPLNMASTVVFYTGILVGFVFLGYLASLFRLNIKYGFAWSFVVNALAVVFLLFSHNIPQAFWAMFLYGVGDGLFWITVHTFELTETHDEERDFYSSVVGAGMQLLSLAGPALATLLIWVSGYVLGWGNFTLLFMVAPCIYLLGFFFFKHLRDYRPKRVEWADVKHFFSERRNQISQGYMLASGFKHVLQVSLPPLITLFLLGTALQVGLYNTLLSAFTALVLLVVAHYRTTENRLSIFGLSCFVSAGLTLWFATQFSLLALIIYSIGVGIFGPLMRVSSHVIDLRTMESIGRENSDFFATMLLRDVILWLGRTLGGLTFLILISYVTSERQYLEIGLYLLAGSLVATYIGAHFLVAKLKGFRVLSEKTGT